MKYADVIINKKIAALDKTFSYAVPDDLEDKVKKGSVVLVHFGRQIVKGIVAGLSDKAEEGFDIKPLLEICNEDVVLSADLIKLADYLHSYYMEPTVSYLRSMIPTGVNLFGDAVKAKTEEVLVYTGSGEENEANLKGKRRLELAALLRERGTLTRKAVMEMGFSSEVIKALAEKGIITREKQSISRNYNKPLSSAGAGDYTLTEQQQYVLDKIRSRSLTDKRPVLIHGVTGSGKTEVYMHLIRDTLDKGKQVIVLLPEIALTPQFVTVFENRFPGETALFHSRRTPGQRRDAWFAFKEGRVGIALGARSCIFAPAKDLGLIIIDEEHETSYEQDNTPRFHALKAAEYRSMISGATLVLGSATPSFESYQKAREGEYMLLEMDSRIHNTPLPLVTIVDMRQELKDGNRSVLSRRLVEQINRTYNDGRQTILYLNRLGYHTFVSCRDCGYVFQCPDCGVSLSYYKKHNSLRCNRCDYEIPQADECPSCGSSRIKFFGLGSEQLEQIVKEEFPNAVVDRFDSEALRNGGNLDDIYMRMHRGETDILIGTQMVAKGWDFPGVELTGIIAADYTLNFPDFRSGEQTFRMLCQVAGRSGRGQYQGKVVLQTYRPDDITLKMACKQNYARYFEYEIQKRQRFCYPPFVHMMKVIIVCEPGFVDGNVRSFIRDAIGEHTLEGTRCFGPSPAVYRENGKEKYTVTVMGKDADATRQVLSGIAQTLRSNRLIDKNCNVMVEIEPLHTV